MHVNNKAILVLSGGQDSTTCLYWALQRGFDCHCLTFDYGQRHVSETRAAVEIFARAVADTERMSADLPGRALSIEVLHLPKDVLLSTSPLVSSNALEQYDNFNVLPGGLEKTFVPLRNQLFLTIAANRAAYHGASHIITGVCEEDYGGYPDCRNDFIDALQKACNLGTFTGEDGAPTALSISTPLMRLSKAQTVRLARDIPGCWDALAYTQTGYDGVYPPRGHDHATLLRAKGFAKAGYADPLVVRAWRAGLMELPNTQNYDLLRSLTGS